MKHIGAAPLSHHVEEAVLVGRAGPACLAHDSAAFVAAISGVATWAPTEASDLPPVGRPTLPADLIGPPN